MTAFEAYHPHSGEPYPGIPRGSQQDLPFEGRMDTRGPAPKDPVGFTKWNRARREQDHYEKNFLPIKRVYDRMAARAAAREHADWSQKNAFDRSFLNDVWAKGYSPTPIPPWVHNRRWMQEQHARNTVYQSYGFNPQMIDSAYRKSYAAYPADSQGKGGNYYKGF